MKWHLPTSAAAEHRGRTKSAVIKDHKVAWDYGTLLAVRLVIDKAGMLQDQEVHFEVIQEYSSGARPDKISLGNVKLNLAEYVEAVDEDGEDEGITRRYLMQDSKINSTLKVGIRMRQIEGDRNFSCPPLRSAAMFGGIAGIMNAAETTDLAGSNEDLAPALASQKARDFGEMQDIYRKTLAASWSSYMNELPADQCIEDIFAGGDGWGQNVDSSLPGSVPTAASNRSQSGAPGQMHGPLAKFLGHSRRSSKDLQHSGRSASAGTRSNASGETANSQSSGSDESRLVNHRLREVSEFELTEDLASWRVNSSSGKLSKLGTPKQAGKVV